MADGYMIFFGILLIIFYAFYSQSKTSRVIRQAERAQNEGRMLQAADIFLKKGKYMKAARIALGLPDNERISILQRISKNLPSSKRKALYTKLGDELVTAKEFVKAASAFELTGNSIRAARYYVLSGLTFVHKGIQLVTEYTRNHRVREETELRNLARFAFQNEKYLETAEILEYLGAKEEANAVLVYAGEEFQKSEQVEGVIETYARTDKENDAIALSMKVAQQMIDQNQLEQAMNYYKKASEIAKSSNKTSKHKKSNKAALATSKLINARKHLKDSKYQLAAELYDTAITEFTGTLSEPLLAEAALAHEKSGNYDRASELYEEAARKTSNEQLAKRFRKKAQSMKVKPVVAPSTDEKNKEEKEQCIICRRAFQSSDKVVRCPHCHTPAHFAHFAEWIKINGKCPVCKNRLTRVELVK